MDNNETTTGPTPAPQAPEAPDFLAQPWLMMVGFRPRVPNDPPAKFPFPHDMTAGYCFSPIVFNDTAHGPRADKTIPAVHLGFWLEKNMAAILSLWEVEFTQYRNMVTASQAHKAPTLRLVDSAGERLQ
jgi:hypothetical protein